MLIRLMEGDINITTKAFPTGGKKCSIKLSGSSLYRPSVYKSKWNFYWLDRRLALWCTARTDWGHRQVLQCCVHAVQYTPLETEPIMFTPCNMDVSSGHKFSNLVWIQYDILIYVTREVTHRRDTLRQHCLYSIQCMQYAFLRSQVLHCCLHTA